MTRLLGALMLCALGAQADVFDDWAEDHNSPEHPRAFLSPSVPKIPMPIGRMEIAKRHWDGDSGVALAIYDQGGGRILPLYVAADVDELGKATFLAWTTESSPAPIAWYGQSADVATTTLGLAAGLSEGNPLLASTPVLAAAGVVKLAAMPALRRHSIEACWYGLGPVGSLGWGAAAWNVAAIAGLGPIGLVPAVAVAVATWPSDAQRFWSCIPSLTAKALQ